MASPCRARNLIASFTSREKVEVASWLSPAKKVELDEVNLGILSELAENARRPVVDIAKKAGLSPEAISQRIRMLERKKFIESYTLDVDLGKLGLNYYKVIFYFKQLTEKRRQAFQEFCSLHPNILYIVEGIGIGDIHLDIEIESRQALQEMLLNLRKNFSDIISDFEVLSVTKEYKMYYSPDFG